MEEIYRGELAIVKEDLGANRTLIRVVDTDTGEILLKKHECDRKSLFPNDCNAIIREALFSREILPNGTELIYVQHPEEDIVYFKKYLSPTEKQFGVPKNTGKGRGNTRGKRKALAIDKEAQNLGDDSLGFYMRLFSLSRADNGLIAKRGKALLQDDIFKTLNVPERTGKRRLTELVKAGLVVKTDEGYQIPRKYIVRG